MSFVTQYGTLLHIKDFQIIEVQAPIYRQKTPGDNITVFAVKIIKEANGTETQEKVPIKSFDTYLRAELYAHTIRSLMEKESSS